MTEKSYATFQEDVAVSDWFGRQGLKSTGRLLELGACHQTAGSQSRLLVEQGWEAVLVDAASESLEYLRREYRGNPKITVVQAVVGADGLVPFYIPPVLHAVATADKGLVDVGHERTDSWKIWAAAVQPDDIVRKLGPFNYVSIDLDGWTLKVMEKLFWALMNECTCVNIEYLREYVRGTDERPVIREYMKQFGFRDLVETDENVVMVRP